MKLLVLATILGLLCTGVTRVVGDIGTANAYGPPYIPTRCYGYKQDQFPPGNMFVTVSEGLWDNGAACGRRYRLRCLSGPNRPCIEGSIDVGVVDGCSRIKPCRSTILISKEAYSAISTSPDGMINIEYVQI